MNGVFNSVMMMSITSSVVILVIIGLRFVFKKKMSGTFAYALWAIVLLKLLLPISFESNLSLFNFVNIQEVVTEIGQNNRGNNEGDFTVITDGSQTIDNKELNETQLLPDGHSDQNKLENSQVVNKESIESENTIKKQEAETPLITESNKTEYLSSEILMWFNKYLMYIWLAVMTIMMTSLITMYIKVYKRFENKVFIGKTSDEISVFESVKTESPVLIGVFKPIIVMPSNVDFSDEQRSYIYKHEGIHIKRKDYLIKLLSLFVAVIHWFNPLVWIAYLLAMKDMELSCDEIVLNKSSILERNIYANTLLELSVFQQNNLVKASVAFGESNIKKRVKSILSFKQLSLGNKIIGVCAFIGIFIVLFSVSGDEKRLLKALNENNGGEIIQVTSDDLIFVNSLEDEVVVLHLAKKDNNTWPILKVSTLEKRFIGYWQGSSQNDIRAIDDQPEYVSNSNVYKLENEDEWLVYGNVTGQGIHNIAIGNSKYELVDKDLNIIEVTTDTYVWYKMLPSDLCEDIYVEVLDENGLVLQGELKEEDNQEKIDSTEDDKENIKAIDEGENSELEDKTDNIEVEDIDLKYSKISETVDYSDTSIHVNGNTITYNKMDLSPLYDELSPSLIDQMIYRSVTYYTYVYTKDFDGIRYFSSDNWQGKIDDYLALGEKRGFEHYQYLSHYSDFDYPIEVTPPVARNGYYTVHMKISDDLWAMATFVLEDEDVPVISNFVFSEDRISVEELHYLAFDYGFDYGWYLDESLNESSIVLMRMADLNLESSSSRLGKKIVLDANHQIVSEEDIEVAGTYTDYYVDDRMLVRPEDSFIVVAIYKVEDSNIKSYLGILPKENLSEPIIIGSYNLVGGAQDVIPVTIAFTMEIHGDGLLYVDSDEFWKINYPLEGMEYSSEKVLRAYGYDTEDINIPIQNDLRVDGDFLNLNMIDGEMLRFNTKTREFVIDKVE